MYQVDVFFEKFLLGSKQFQTLKEAEEYAAEKKKFNNKWISYIKYV